VVLTHSDLEPIQPYAAALTEVRRNPSSVFVLSEGLMYSNGATFHSHFKHAATWDDVPFNKALALVGYTHCLDTRPWLWWVTHIALIRGLTLVGYTHCLDTRPWLWWVGLLLGCTDNNSVSLLAVSVGKWLRLCCCSAAVVDCV
jgi:hypothetical protein